MDNLKHDLEVVEQEGAEVGLHLNKGKSEIICANPEILDPIVHCLPQVLRELTPLQLPCWVRPLEMCPQFQMLLQPR